MARRAPAQCGTRDLLVGIMMLAAWFAASRRAGPSVDLPPPAPEKVTASLSAYEQATLVAAQRQAWGTVVGAVAGATALLVSLAAFFISLRTWQSQTERDERVYSAQVALWAAVGSDVSSVLPGGLDVHVQNLAPVPMHQARVIAALTSGDMAEGMIGDMLPCTVQSFRIAPPAGQTFVKGTEQWLGYTDLVLEFTENSHSWRLTKAGVEHLATPPQSGGLPKLVQANHEISAAGNCA